MTLLSLSPLFLSLSPLCDVTCCRALAYEAWLPSPPCDATCCRALAHKALSPLPLRDAMCQQLVRMRTRGSGDASKAELGYSELG
jgi:hypothetical protein